MSEEKNGKTKNNSEGNGGDAGLGKEAMDVNQSIQSSFESVREELLNVEKGHKTAITVKVIILIVSIIYLSWLFTMIKQVDANGLVETIKLDFMSKLPAYSQQISKDLKASAPETIDNAKKQVDEMIPQLRIHMQDEVLKQTQVLTDSIGKDVDTIVEEYVKTHAESIKEKKPDATDLERAKELFGMIRTDFKGMVQGSINEHLDKYKEGIKTLNIDLKKLKAGKGLDEKEKIQRKLVCVWVKLMKVEQKKITPEDIRGHKLKKVQPDIDQETEDLRGPKMKEKDNK